MRYVLWQRVAPRVGLGRALGHRVPEPIDTSRVELLDQVSEEDLRDAGRLEREVLPRLGLNADLTELLPPALQPYLDQGLRYSQYPNQFGPYLACLARYPVRSYMEVGVQHGGTFLITTAYLSRLHALDRAVAVDMFAVPALLGRPIAAAHSDVLAPRQAVPAGMTGWWQINGRSRVTADEALRLDLFYIENWSPTLDLYILLKTLGAVVKREGAY